MHLDYQIQSFRIPKQGHLRIKPLLKKTNIENYRISTEQTPTPSTNLQESRDSNGEDEKRNQFNFNFYASNGRSEKLITDLCSSKRKQELLPIDQIKLIMNENEKLRRHLNAKQKIIDTITKSKETMKHRDRIDTQEITQSYRNSQSCLQQSTNDQVMDKKTSVSQNIKRSFPRINKLPQIEESLIKVKSPKAEDCNFTFANNFFPTDEGNSSHSKRLNMFQAFPQYHLKKKFFT